MIATGRIDQVRISKRVVRIPRSALQELVERGGPATGAR
jgi:hypothetical protein